MTWTPKTRRRWFGAVCVVAAVAMLVFGETKPPAGASLSLFVAYWTGCFALAALAMLTAILDARALRHEARDEQRTLFENTLQNIETEKRRRAGNGNPSGDSAEIRD